MALIQKLTSLDVGYTTGDLSLFPEVIDTKAYLYPAKNNSETFLLYAANYTSKYLLVESTDGFPDQGILRIGSPVGTYGPSELIYYNTKAKGIFRDLIRGFAGSRQSPWNVKSSVSSGVMAEHHNSIKDAVIKIENKLGVKDFPEAESLNGILKELEVKFITPKAIFRAYPIKGKSPLKVRFQNFSTGPIIRYLWDFGDGTTSIEKSPTHNYLNEGYYTVKLNVINTLGAQAICKKSNYILVDNTEVQPFFYVTPAVGSSIETSGVGATEFEFVDQTEGNITQRYWVFGGVVYYEGERIESGSINVTDPNVHNVKVTYESPSEYNPSLLVIFDNQNQKNTYLEKSILVQ